MARQTNTRLREKVIYSVFVRNHTKEGTFQALEGDLDRLAALGTDIIWLMPIHPHRGGRPQGDAGKSLRHPGLPRHQPGVRHAGGLHASGGGDPQAWHEVHHRRGV